MITLFIGIKIRYKDPWIGASCCLRCDIGTLGAFECSTCSHGHAYRP